MSFSSALSQFVISVIEVFTKGDNIEIDKNNKYVKNPLASVMAYLWHRDDMLQAHVAPISGCRWEL